MDVRLTPGSTVHSNGDQVKMSKRLPARMLRLSHKSRLAQECTLCNVRQFASGNQSSGYPHFVSLTQGCCCWRAQIADFVLGEYRRNGINVHLHTSPTKFEKNNDGSVTVRRAHPAVK